jgi:LPS sulfotransferase NodH
LRGPLFARLRSAPGLIFVGKREYIEYLAEVFGTASPHAFVRADDPVDSWERLLAGRVAVVATSDDEDAIAADVGRVLAQLGHRVRVARLFADLFVNVMSGGHLWQPTPRELATPTVAYAILGTPRCGSEFLCEALTSTQVAGYPQEDLRSQSEALTKYCRFDADRYLRTLMSRRVTPNGVFGTKLISHFLLDHIKLCSELERTLTRFKFIRILRRDIIGQAISAMLASRTQVYHVRDVAEHQRYAERLGNLQISPEDLRHVDLLCNALSTQNGQIDEFFSRHRITPLVLTYEDLIVQPLATVNAILSFLSVAAKIQSVAVTVRRTRSEFSNAVRAMYLEGAKRF